MLVFTRKCGESIMIGDGIEIAVIRTGRDSVRLGIVAPRDITVHRREVYDAIVEANRSAASGAATDVAGLARQLRQKTAGQA